MNLIQHTFRIALLVSAIFVWSNSVFAQGKVLELLPGAEKMGFNEKMGVHFLVGGVNFIYQGNTMYCDSAHYNDKKNEVTAYGNVHVTKGEINLFCDSLYYNGNTRKAKLWSRVKVRDLQYKLSSDTVEYDAKNALAIYRYGGKIESITDNEVLTSKVAYMYTDAKNFIFGGKVNYKSDAVIITTDTLKFFYQKNLVQFMGPSKINNKATKMYCEKGWYNTKTEEGTLYKNAKIFNGQTKVYGDTLNYAPQKSIMSGRGHVVILDTVQQLEFRGNYMYSNDKKQISFITKKALAIKLLENKEKKSIDSLFIHADTLFTAKDKHGKPLFLKAYHKAGLYKSDLQGISDSINYDLTLGELTLYKSPILWAQNAELKADSIKIHIKDSILEQAILSEHANIIMQLDSGSYYNQLAGKVITAHFNKNQLIRSDVVGNARTIFFPEENKNTDTSVVVTRKGMNRLYASELRVYLDSGEVKGITYFDKPDGVFYPMDKINPEEQLIPDFKWNPLLRPKSWKEFIR